MERMASRSRVYDRDFSSEDNRSESGDIRDGDNRESRAGTTDSEEIALSNGKKTLEEVAAKLNDLEGTERRLGNGKRGLISVDRIPFLTNLFNYRATNGIVVDEEDANHEDNPIADIFVWRFPLVTAIWFVVIQQLFFLVHFCELQLVSVVAFLGIWLFIVDFSLANLVPKLQKAGIASEDLDIKDILRKNYFFNAKFIKRVSSAVYEISDIMIGMWRVTVMEANLSRVLIVGRFVFVVFFRSFSVHTTIYLIIMILFTIPVSYSSNRALADAVADGAHLAANRRFQSLKRFTRRIVDITADHARLNYELSKKAPANKQGQFTFKAGIWAFLLGFAQNLDWFVNKLLG